MTTNPNADVLAAVRWMLLDDNAISALVSDRIWGSDLDRTEIASMPRKNIVLSLGGRVPSAGDNSYIGVERLRIDVRCYGEDSYEARSVWRHVDAYMRAIVPTTIDLTDHSVRIWNAVASFGPVAMTDPDADWPSVSGAWGVVYALTSIPPVVVSS